ncbi:helix-turn-helix domain-containing protein [Arthrobacter sp. zg-Y20]|uniref:helix-turn-helix domain-containing protein n=1 Tax=unclassified Arthrobacter TaxID=235627 RepID=UPI001D15C890|nr:MULTISPECIES: helix-turn-helix transcriptional regulator [unclassified Arthrobacter]MCC3277486.1 helix-turn-helix domain-containing protein [Arthrobacter sp. zg-Y20]MDK1317647.1 helix-turn-helix transcriptional regulator [Arthrobacter sp. zg.Y20]WIB07093.1 helix-turn-helix transcriptional regulator [Arthrobacter sp. zg-Y20]
MRTTTLQRRPANGSATVTDITSRRAGRPAKPPEFITEEIREGALVAKFRDDLGMTQAELAFRVTNLKPKAPHSEDHHLARSTLGQYEKGLKRMPDTRVETIAEVLGVEPWLIRIIQTLPLGLTA